jgi:hypothetical protein
MTTIPESLVRYEQQLAAAARADLAARRRRRLAIRVSLACAAAGAVALGALSVFDHGSSVVRPASAESVVRRSMAALAQKPETILHVRMLGFQDNGDGSTISWSDESWQAESPPYGRRTIAIGPYGGKVESASDAHGEQVYDSASNTIYVGPRTSGESPEELNRPHLLPGPRPGTVLLRVGPARKSALTLVISAAQAKAFRAGKLGIGFKLSKQGGSLDDAKLVLMPIQKRARKASPSQSPDPWSPAFRDQVLELLKSGGARVVGHKTIDGRDTIEISSDDGHTVYYVDPGSYQPVELDTHGTDGGTKLRFREYEWLPIAGNADLLSLTAQHPAAHIDRKAADYQAAQARLFPHG